jgi:hypothetical protein
MIATALEAIAGLLVEDGWIASGTIGALAAIGLAERAGDPLRDVGGPLLFLFLMVLLLVNLYTTGRKARKHGVS